MIAIIYIVCLATNANAENTGGTVEKRKDEETFVRTVASVARANDTDYTIDAETLADELDKYVGTGKTTVTEQSSDTLLVTFLATGNEYEININTGLMSENITTLGTYLPKGFTEVSTATATTGLTIEDSSGNQYVWVEVPKTTEVYPTAGLSITEFTSDEYTAIENDLHTYRNGTSYTDTWYSEDASGLTETEYYTLKNKMLKSVYENGGFYIGRYETGIADSYRRANTTLQTPVIQADAYPYTYVKNSQAQTLASGMESGEYTSSLMFGVQWDLVIKYFETKGVATEAELNEDSSTWGNYYNNLWSVVSTTAKYSIDKGTTYTAMPYTKTAKTGVLLTTGADSSFNKMWIYDIAGNVWEWTLEHANSNSSYPCAIRGGVFDDYSTKYPSSSRGSYSTAHYDFGVGFRVSIF